jgi:Aspartyl aminopeptidase
MTKEQLKSLKDNLLINRQNGGDVLSQADIDRAYDFAEGYKAFLNACKTERETVDFCVAQATAQGYTEFKAGKKYSAGDKVYYNNRGKALILAVIGSADIAEGVNMLASHGDSPCLHLKPCPLYEDAQIAYFKTHYYGGIKKYQWIATPLSLHGTVIKSDGEKVTMSLGEQEGDPVFTISDLLPHLGTEQMKRTLADGIKGEELNAIVGLNPVKADDEEKMPERVKLNIIRLLNEKYGITESELLSAELMFVPAFKAADVGFDRGAIGAYGQDDRVCVYASLQAILNVKSPKRTTLCVVADKEEVGSGGNTGLTSAYLKYFIADLAESFGTSGRAVLSNSRCISADVTAAHDAVFPDVTERRNTAYLNYGVCISKYTGARGKSGTSDASAEFTADVCGIFDKNNILWQHGELGKVDAGGGGTVAVYLAELGLDVLDAGVPVISMHSPFELTSKIDVWQTYMAYKVFLEN